ncbi:MAG: hypothetical protein HY235_01485 [Acidobacteria bacterium]|nr:hypothetical protein [Acidobacteriota bacterium]
MEFVLTGFRQDNNIRRYAFQGIAADRKRTEFTVGVDLSLVRKYQIPLQELPLLCCHLLTGHAEGGQTKTLTFTEEDMRGYASRRAAAQDAADLKRKAHRRPPSSRTGQAWRSQMATESGSGKNVR